MKSFSRIFMFLTSLLLLTACVNIPIGDGNNLKISKDGVTFTDDEGDQHKLEVSDDGVKVTDGKTGEEKIDLSEDGLSFKDEKGQEQKITFDQDGEQLVMEGFDDKGHAVGMQMGENVELPKDLPKDIPLTKDAKVSMSTNSNREVIVGYATFEDVADVRALYDDYFKKGKFEAEPEILEQSYDEMYSKNYHGIRADGEISVQVIEIKGEEHGIQVAIHFYKDQDE